MNTSQARGELILATSSKSALTSAASGSFSTTGGGTSEMLPPPSEPYTNGSCRAPVSFITSSRTRPKARRMSRPGTVRFFRSAVVNGLWLPSPSSAVDPAFAA